MDLELNNLQRLICPKSQTNKQTNKQTNNNNNNNNGCSNFASPYTIVLSFTQIFVL